MKKVLVLLAMIFVVGVGEAKEQVRIATSAGLHPYIFGVEDGCKSSIGFCGFEVELFMEICRVEDLDCKWVRNEWSTIFDNLVTPQDNGSFAYDAIVDSTDATADRRMRMLFSAPYYSTKLLFLGESDLDVNIDSNGFPVDDRVIKMGTWKGYLMDELLKVYPNPKNIKLVETSNPVEDLKNGEIDLAFLFTGLEVELVRTRNYQVKGGLIDIANSDPLGGVGAATRVNLSGRALQQKFSQGLIKVRQSGFYKRVSEEWMGRDVWNCVLGPQIQDPLCSAQ